MADGVRGYSLSVMHRSHGCRNECKAVCYTESTVREWRERETGRDYVNGGTLSEAAFEVERK